MIEAAFAGKLSADAEARTSKSGKKYLRLNLRVGDGRGAQWVNVTSFDADAIAAADKFVKGAPVYCEGALKLDEWIGRDGAERHGLSCLSWHTRLAAIGRNRPKRESNGGEAQANSSAPSNSLHSDDIPF